MHRWRSITSLGISVSLCLVVSLAYSLQPDSWAALTILPRWPWLVPGLVFALCGWRRGGTRFVVAVGILWFLYAAIFVEEIASLTRWRSWPSSEWQTARPTNTVLRVVSLNCAGGSKEAAAEVARYHPDIVLLQETPVRTNVEQLAKWLFGTEAGVVCGMDTSIIVRGQVVPTGATLPRNFQTVQARVQLSSGIKAEVISVRLPPFYEVRTDLWSPACWRTQASARRQFWKQMRNLTKRIVTLPENVPVIVGGDFNAPGGDAIFRLLKPRLHDSFREGGIGWGDTIINEFPFLRIDQIWVSDHFRAASVVARRTEHSDHRMVICDLVSVRNP